MKKIIFIFFMLIFINFYIFNFEGFSKTNIKEKIDEEIIPIRNRNGKFMGIICNITIPKDFKEKSIIVKPSIFGGINEFSNMEIGKKIIQIKINNKSKYKYKYKKNSFHIKMIDKDINKDLDNLKIFAPKRVINTALKDLLDSNYTEDNIDKKLKEKGFNGIKDLNKYYLEYYNNKYKLKCSKLNYFKNSIIKEIFDGDIIEDSFEINEEIIKLAYNYFYNNILSFTINGKTKSIGKYINNNISLKEFVDVNKKSSKKIKNISLNVNDKYMTNAFNNYNYFGEVEFILSRS